MGELVIDGAQYDLFGYPGTDFKLYPLPAGDRNVFEIDVVSFGVGVEAVEIRSGGYVQDELGNDLYSGPHAIFDYPPIGDPGWRTFGPTNPTHIFEPGERVEGFSGGGIWRIAFQGDSTRLWDPQNQIRLCGIQSFWSKRRRQLGAVPISEWKAWMNKEQFAGAEAGFAT